MRRVDQGSEFVGSAEAAGKCEMDLFQLRDAVKTEESQWLKAFLHPSCLGRDEKAF